MFTDGRSREVLFVAHCVLNQNSISDGTADFPGMIREVVDVLRNSDVGVVQMPCPELMCLGLDRGNPEGAASPVVVENTRIRGMLEREQAAGKIEMLAGQVIHQISEYSKHGFQVRGIVGINRSPSCGVETTSRHDREVKGQGVFIEALNRELELRGLEVKIAGIKASAPEEAAWIVENLISYKPL